MKKIFVFILIATLITNCGTFPQSNYEEKIYEEKIETQKKNKEEEEKKQAWFKPAVIAGGILLFGVGGWRLFRHLNTSIMDNLAVKSGKIAFGSRVPSDVKIVNPPMYRLIAPDGSEHTILGTYHTTGVSFPHDFPRGTRIHEVMKEATVLMPEVSDFRLTSLLKHLRAQAKSDVGEGFYFSRSDRFDRSMEKDLGEKRVELLEKMLKGHVESYLSISHISHFSHPSEAIEMIYAYGMREAYGLPGLMMDTQISRLGRRNGKKVIGLEKDHETLEKLRDATGAQIREHYIGNQEIYKKDIKTLKNLIDRGGIDEARRVYLKIREAYARGDIDEVMRFFDKMGGTAAMEKYLLDKRNIAWVESGLIQKNCTNKEKCFIYVGSAHLFKGDNSLKNLLEKKGFTIEKF